MKKRNRILSFLLTVTMLLSNFESFAMTAYAYDGGVIRDDVNITDEALNSHSDDAEDEQSDDADTGDRDAQDDDAQGSSAQEDENGGEDTDGRGAQDDDAQGSSSQDDQNGENSGDDAQGGDDQNADDDENNGADPSLNEDDENTGDESNPSNDDQNADDSVSDNSVSDNSVSDNSVRDNTVSENSVSENETITSEAMNNGGDTLNVKLVVRGVWLDDEHADLTYVNGTPVTPIDETYYYTYTGAVDLSSDAAGSYFTIRFGKGKGDFYRSEGYTLAYEGIAYNGGSVYDYTDIDHYSWTAVSDQDLKIYIPDEGWKDEGKKNEDEIDALVSAINNSAAKPLTITVTTVPVTFIGYESYPEKFAVAGSLTDIVKYTQKYKDTKYRDDEQSSIIRLDLQRDYVCESFSYDHYWDAPHPVGRSYGTYLDNVTCNLNNHDLTFKNTSVWTDQLVFYGRDDNSRLILDNAGLIMERYDAEIRLLDLEILVLKGSARISISDTSSHVYYSTAYIKDVECTGTEGKLTLQKTAVVQLAGKVSLTGITLETATGTATGSKLQILSGAEVNITAVSMGESTQLNVDGTLTAGSFSADSGVTIGGFGTLNVEDKLNLKYGSTLTLRGKDEWSKLAVNAETISGKPSGIVLTDADLNVDEMSIAGGTFVFTGKDGSFNVGKLTADAKTEFTIGESGKESGLKARIDSISGTMKSLELKPDCDLYILAGNDPDKITESKITTLTVGQNGHLYVGRTTWEATNYGDGTENRPGALTLTTLNTDTGTGIYIAFDSTLKVTGTANLQSGSEIRNHGVADFNDVKLGYCEGQRDVHFLTDNSAKRGIVTERAKWYIRGNVTSTAFTGEDGESSVVRIILRHTPTLELPGCEWWDNITGYNSQDNIIYIAKTGTLSYLHADRGNQNNDNPDLPLKLVGSTGGLYTVRAEAIELYRVPVVAGQALSDYDMSNKELVASSFDLNDLLEKITIDREEKGTGYVYYIPLKAKTTVSNISIQVPDTPLVIEGIGSEQVELNVQMEINYVPDILFRNVNATTSASISIGGDLYLEDSRLSKAEGDVNIIGDLYLENSRLSNTGEDVTIVGDLIAKDGVSYISADQISITEKISVSAGASLEIDLGETGLDAGKIEMAKGSGAKHAELYIHSTNDDPGYVSFSEEVDLGDASVLKIEDICWVNFSDDVTVADGANVTIQRLTATYCVALELQNVLSITGGATFAVSDLKEIHINKVAATAGATVLFRKLTGDTNQISDISLSDSVLEICDSKVMNLTSLLIKGSSVMTLRNAPMQVEGDVTMGDPDSGNAAGPHLEADSKSRLTVKSGITMYRGAELTALGGLTVNVLDLYDDASVYAADSLSLSNINLCASDQNKNAGYVWQPGIATAPGTDFEVSAGISRSDNNLRLQLTKVNRSYGADGLPVDTFVGYEAGEAILKTTDPDVYNVDPDIFYIPLSAKGDTSGNCSFVYNPDESEYHFLKLIGITVYAAPADAPQYMRPEETENGVFRVDIFTSYEEAIAYVGSIANASQRYYVVFDEDTTLSAGQLNLPANGTQIVLCGPHKDNVRDLVTLTVNNGSALKQKLNNNLMFMDLEVVFADGTELDLNGKTLILCDAKVTGLKSIGSKGALVLRTSKWGSSDIPLLDVTGKVNVTTLDMTNYRLRVPALTVAGDAYLYQSQILGLGGKSNKISGSLYMDHQSCLALADTTGGAFTVARNLYLRNGSCISTSNVINIPLDRDTSLTVNGDTYLAGGSLITVGRNVTLKNLYSASADNRIVYGSDTKDLLKITGKVAEAQLDAQEYFTDADNALTKTVDWQWTGHGIIAPSGITLEAEVAGSDNPDDPSHTMIVGYAVNVWRLCREDSDSSDETKDDLVDRAGLYKGDNVPAIVTTAAEAKFFRLGSFRDNNGDEYVIYPLVSRNKALYVDTSDRDAAVVLYMENATASSAYNAQTGYAEYSVRNMVGAYATLQEAFTAIKALNRKDGVYRIEIKNYNGITDVKTNWTLPTAAARIRIVNCVVDTDNPKTLYFKNALTLQTNLELEGIKLKTDDGVAASIALNGYGLQLYDCDLSELNVSSVKGNGTAKTSSLTIIHPINDSTPFDTTPPVWIYGDIKDVGIICLSNTALYVTGTVTVGNVRAYAALQPVNWAEAEEISVDDEGELESSNLHSGYTNMAVNSNTTSKLVVTAVQKDGVIIPNLTVTGSVYGGYTTYTQCKEEIADTVRYQWNGSWKTGAVTRTTYYVLDSYGNRFDHARLNDTNNNQRTRSAEISIALMVKGDSGYEDFFANLPADEKTNALAAGLPLVRTGTVGESVYYSDKAMVRGIAKYYDVRPENLIVYDLSMIRRTIGKDKYICVTSGKAIYKLYVVEQGEEEMILGANDWATIVAEIDARKAKQDYKVELCDNESSGRGYGIINDMSEGSKTMAETLTMPKAGNYESLKICTDDFYTDNYTIPAWNYIGDRITLNGNTTLENIRLVGYKDAAILKPDGSIDTDKRLSTENAKTNKPTLTVQISGAYTLTISDNVLVDGRQLMLEGANKGILKLESDGRLYADGETHEYYTSSGIEAVKLRGTITKMAEVIPNSHMFEMQGYVKTVGAAAPTAPSFQATDLTMIGNNLYVMDDEIKAGSVTVTNLTIGSGANLYTGTLTVTDLINPSAGNVTRDCEVTVRGAAKITGSVTVASDHLIFTVTQDAKGGSNLTIGQAVNNTVGDTSYKIRVQLKEADEINDNMVPDLLYANLTAEHPKNRFAMVNAGKASADQFVAYSDVLGDVIEYSSSNPDNYRMISDKGVIYAYPGSAIKVAVLRADPVAVGQIPDSAPYHNEGEVAENNLLGYYPTYPEAVAAITAANDPQQGYAIVLLDDVDLGKSISVPAKAAYVHIYGMTGYQYENDYVVGAKLTFAGASTFATNVYLENLTLVNPETNTKSKTFYGYPITVNGAYTLGIKNITQNIYANRPISQLKMPKGTLLLENAKVHVTGTTEVYAAKLSGADRFDQKATLSSYGKLTVGSLLTMKEYSGLYGYAEMSIRDILLADNKEIHIVSHRLKGGAAALTISGTITGKGLEIDSEFLYYPTTESHFGDGRVTFNDDHYLHRTLDKYNKPAVTQTLPADRLLFKAPNAENGQITVRIDGDPLEENDTIIRTSDGFYVTKDPDILSGTVLMKDTDSDEGAWRYLDLNEAVKRINAIGDIDKCYRVELPGRIVDTNVTDKVVCSPLPLPAKDKAKGMEYTAMDQVQGTDLYYSGNIDAYAGGSGPDGLISFKYLRMYPWKASAPAGLAGNEAAGTTVKISGNGSSKQRVTLELIGTTVKVPWKSISGSADRSAVHIDTPLTLTEGFSKLQRVWLEKGTAEGDYVTTKNSNIGTLLLSGGASFAAIGTTTVDTVTTVGLATIKTTFTEKGAAKTPNFTVTGDITGTGLIIVPMRSLYSEQTIVNGKSRTVTTAISAANYMNKHGQVFDYILDPTGLSAAEQLALYKDVPLMTAKRADPARVGVRWDPEMQSTAMPGSAVISRDVNGYVMVMDSSEIQLNIIRIGDPQNGIKSVTIAAKSWAEAVTIIDSIAQKDAGYRVELISTAENHGIFPLGRNGTRAAAVWPKAASAARVEIHSAEPAVLQYTGALNPTCSVSISNVKLEEYTAKGELNGANSINLSGAVELEFSNVTTQDHNKLCFKTVTAKSGTIVLNSTDLYTTGAINVAGAELRDGADINVVKETVAASNDWNAPDGKGTATVSITDLKVNGYDIAIRSMGKITLGTVTGIFNDYYISNSSPEGAEYATGDDTLTLDDYFTPAAPEKSVTQLSINGRVEGVRLEVHPYFVSDDKGTTYAQYTHPDEITLYADPAKAPAAAAKLLTAPYLETTDLSVITYKDEHGYERVSLEGYRGADDSRWLTKYEGGVYLADAKLDPVVCVTDTYCQHGDRKSSTLYLSWEQSVKDVNRFAAEGHEYSMYLMDDIGVTWADDVTGGIVTGRHPSAVAKTLALPAVKAGSVTILSRRENDPKSLYFAANSITITGEKLTLENVGLNSLKITRKAGNDVITPQNYNVTVKAGTDLDLCNVYSDYGCRMNNVTGMATSELQARSDMEIAGAIKSFGNLTVNAGSMVVAGDVNVSTLNITGAELHAANINVTGLTTLGSGGKGYTLAADSSTAVGTGAVVLNDVDFYADFRYENLIVSKLNAKGETQLTIKGRLEKRGENLCIGILYGNGNKNYAVLYLGQVLVNGANATQAAGLSGKIYLYRRNYKERGYGPVVSDKNVVLGNTNFH